ncbi:MAG: alpha amylase C-terminal domain-containing protein [Pseudomonadota bacterium]
MFEQDHDAAGFEWIDHNNDEQSILIFVRKAASSSQKVYCVCNFTPLPRDNFRFGVLDEGDYRLIFNSDSQHYWGSNQVTGETFVASPVSCHEKPFSLTVNVPPLSTLYILYDA